MSTAPLLRRVFAALVLPSAVAVGLLAPPRPSAMAAEEVYPRHVNRRQADAVKKGLDYLAKTQTADGNWINQRDGAAYPVSMASLAGMAFLANGNTPHRGPYAEHIGRTVQYLIGNATPGGLITGPSQEQGRPMYGHGFGLLFLASCYGMETDERTQKSMRRVIENAINELAYFEQRGPNPWAGDVSAATPPPSARGLQVEPQPGE